MPRLWTSDEGRGYRVAARLEAGNVNVNVNDAYAAAWGSMDAPMGGMKAPLMTSATPPTAPSYVRV